MKIGIGIIALLLGLTAILQSCTVSVGSNLIEDLAMTEAGALGTFVGLLIFMGGAFSFGAPKVAMIIFAIAAVLGFGGATSGAFQDLIVWGFVAAILAVTTFFVRKPRVPKDE